MGANKPDICLRELIGAESDAELLAEIAEIDRCIFPGNVWGEESFSDSMKYSFDCLTAAVIQSKTDQKEICHRVLREDGLLPCETDQERSCRNKAQREKNKMTRVAGFGLLRCFDDAEVVRIAVRSEYRREGIGSRLLEGLISEAKRRKVSGIFLEVRSSNLAAVSMYRRAGFTEEGIRKNYYSSPAEDALIMRYTC
ncbi:MAG: ribosomal protein S18-alanine N-acetyltransferase [Clostridiales bacterium]|nr:ribosomal protein S18-alanine N-acetyltransferase [Clostridiales bacterium]